MAIAVAMAVTAVALAPAAAGGVTSVRTEHRGALRVVSSTVEPQGCGRLLSPYCRGHTWVRANGFGIEADTYLVMRVSPLLPSLLGARITAREVVESNRLPFWPEVTVHDTTESCLLSRDGDAPRVAGRLRVYLTVGTAEPVLAADESAEGCGGRTAQVDLREFAKASQPVRLRIVREVWLGTDAVALEEGVAWIRRDATLRVTAGQ